MVQDTPSRELDKIIVRLPDGMRNRLKAAAETNNRSMNAEVVARLEASFLDNSDSPPSLDRLAKAIENIQTMLEPINKLSKKRGG